MWVVFNKVLEITQEWISFVQNFVCWLSSLGFDAMYDQRTEIL